MTIYQTPQLINIPKSADSRGEICFLEFGKEIGFVIKRIYYIKNVPQNKDRGNHAHKRLSQLMIAMAGSFDILLDDGRLKSKFNLNRSNLGLYIPPGYYRTLNNFSADAICLVCASEIYSEEDYIYDYNEFLRYANFFIE